MSRTILAPHLREDGGRGPLLLSLAAHVGLLIALLVGIDLWGPVVVELGSGEAGGPGGGAVAVGLVGELQSGGAGLVKPSPIAKPEVFTPPEEKKPEPPPVSPPDRTVFEQAKPDAPKPPPDWRKKPDPPKPPPPRQAPAGAIPRDAEPGSGGRPGGGAGSGAGTGSGGVSLGSGEGTGGIDSWYVRQVEKRIGDNWLKTALGELKQRVRTRISFEIAADGQIEAVRIEESSGVSGVDVAAQRAVLASNPLPPPPFEMRRRRIKFVANFEYPPR